MSSILNICFIYKSEKFQYYREALPHFHCHVLGISIVECIVFAVCKCFICIAHLTFGGFMASQDYFTLFSHGKQVDRTEEEVCYRELPHNLQAQHGFPTSGPNLVRTCSYTAA